MESAVLGVVLGILVVVLGYGWAVCDSKYAISKKKEQRNSNSRTVIAMSVAAIANDLVPIILGLENLQGSRVCVVGNDGRYIVKQNGNTWKKGIKDWVKAGIEVNYVLLHPDQDVKKELQYLLSDVNNDGYPGQLRVYILSEDRSQEVNSVATKMETFHPTLFTAVDGRKAMWLEGIHEPNTVYAYNIRYFSPNAMTPKAQNEFAGHEQKLNTLLGCSEELVAQARN